MRDLAARRPKYLIFEELHSSSEMGKSVDMLQSRDEIQQLLALYRLDKTATLLVVSARGCARGGGALRQIADIRAGLCADPYGNLLFA